MAKIERSQSRAGQLTRNVNIPQISPPRTGDFSQGTLRLGSSLIETGAKFDQLARAQKQREDEQKRKEEETKRKQNEVLRKDFVNTATNSVLTGASELLEENKRTVDPNNIKGFADRFDEEYKVLTEQALLGAPDKQASDTARLSMEDSQVGFRKNAYTFENEQIALKVVNNLNEDLDNLKTNAFRQPGMADIFAQKGMDEINRSVGDIFDPGQLQETVDDFTAGLYATAVDGLIRTNPPEALKQLKAGEFDDVLDTKTVNKKISDAEKAITAIAKAVKTEQEKLVKKIQNENTLRFKRQILVQTRQGIPFTDKDFADLDQAIEDKLINETQGLAVLTAMTRAEAKVNKKAEARIELQDRVDHGLLLFSDNLEHVDFVDQEYASSPRTPDDTKLMLEKYNIIPTQVKQNIRTFYGSDDVEKVSGIAEHAKAIKDEAPGAVEQLGGLLTEFNWFVDIQNKIEVGVDPETIVPIAIRSLTRSKEEKAEISKRFQTATSGKKNTNTITNKRRLTEFIARDFKPPNQTFNFGIHIPVAKLIKIAATIGADGTILDAVPRVLDPEFTVKDFSLPFGILKEHEQPEPTAKLQSQFDAVMRVFFGDMVIQDAEVAGERTWEQIKDNVEVDLTGGPVLRFIESPGIDKFGRQYADNLASKTDDEITVEAENISDENKEVKEGWDEIESQVRSGKSPGDQKIKTIVDKTDKNIVKAELITSYKPGFINNLDSEAYHKGGLGGLVKFFFKLQQEKKDDQIWGKTLNDLTEQIEVLDGRIGQGPDDLISDDQKERDILLRQRADIAETWNKISIERYADARIALEKLDEVDNISLEQIVQIAISDPGGMFAQLINVIYGDPEYLLFPIGAVRAAALGVALTVKMTFAAQRAAAIAAGAVGTSAAAFATELPISAARQLGEPGGFVSGERVLAEAKVVAVLAPFVVGAFLLTGKALGKIIPKLV